VDHVTPDRCVWTAFVTGKLQNLCEPFHRSAKPQIELCGYRSDIGLPTGSRLRTTDPETLRDGRWSDGSRPSTIGAKMLPSRDHGTSSTAAYPSIASCVGWMAATAALGNFGLPRCKKIVGDILCLIQADPARCSVSSEICVARQFPFQLADGPRPYL
jgi:hypothetical protein